MSTNAVTIKTTSLPMPITNEENPAAVDTAPLDLTER
jgi:hypothetical protein